MPVVDFTREEGQWRRIGHAPAHGSEGKEKGKENDELDKGRRRSTAAVVVSREPPTGRVSELHSSLLVNPARRGRKGKKTAQFTFVACAPRVGHAETRSCSGL